MSYYLKNLKKFKIQEYEGQFFQDAPDLWRSKAAAGNKSNPKSYVSSHAHKIFWIVLVGNSELNTDEVREEASSTWLIRWNKNEFQTLCIYNNVLALL